ncbi:SmpA / OmlA family protein [Pseudomonas flavescens]|uniref:SmpA / OmlA family protein n=1 Tax=Phytopseudomonas flavescens TaxID=29435 RepID=A0A1G8J6U5_9GAMM|nr:outer membrane protein assembly factor BamE [Pseudomonas flavescens]SDI26753.1 SmpA / OmlA family protein [Pseudomonas flavescens]
MQWIYCAAACAIALYPAPLFASSVFRCEDAEGHITFTLHGCAESQRQHIQETHNARPGSGAAVPLATPQPRAESKEATTTGSSLTVIGERQDGCGNLVTGNTRREAVIRKQVRTGMTRRDVESALGKPERISRRNGQTTYHYARKGNDQRRTVSFDQNDCVTGKR